MAVGVLAHLDNISLAEVLASSGLVVGYQGVILPVEPAYYVSAAGLVVGLLVQIALFAPLELGRRICQILFASRLTRQGMNNREFLTTWSAIFSLNYRGVEDPHMRQGAVTNLLLVMYFAESIAIGSIGSLYYQSPVPYFKAQGHVPAYGPLQLQIYSSADADGAITLSQEAALSFSRLYDPVVIGGMLVPDQSLCPFSSPPSSSGMHTSCTGIVASPLTLPDLTNGETAGNTPVLDWLSIAVDDVFDGVFSTVGIQAACSSLSAANVTGSIVSLTAINETTNLALELPNGDTISGSITLYAARSPYYSTPMIQVEAMGWGDTFVEPYITDTGGMYVALVAFNFADTFADMTTVPVPMNDDSDPQDFRNMSVALCELKVLTGRADAEIRITSTKPSLVSTLVSATYVDKPQVYDMSNATTGAEGGVSGYGTAQFLWQALMEMSCDMLPCAFQSSSPPGFNLVSGLVSRTPDGTGWQVDYANQLPTITRALSKLSTLFLSAYLNASDAFDTDPSSVVVATSPNLRVAVFTNRACRTVLQLGGACAVLLIVLHFLSLSPARVSVRWLNPESMWMTDSIHSLLWYMKHVDDDEVVHAGVVDAEFRKRDGGVSRRGNPG
ncbi:hypothetical protein HKX48_001972, partial [Thoreauomyces humboldtii]